MQVIQGLKGVLQNERLDTGGVQINHHDVNSDGWPI